MNPLAAQHAIDSDPNPNPGLNPESNKDFRPMPVHATYASDAQNLPCMPYGPFAI